MRIPFCRTLSRTRGGRMRDMVGECKVKFSIDEGGGVPKVVEKLSKSLIKFPSNGFNKHRDKCLHQETQKFFSSIVGRTCDRHKQNRCVPSWRPPLPGRGRRERRVGAGTGVVMNFADQQQRRGRRACAGHANHDVADAGTYAATMCFSSETICGKHSSLGAHCVFCVVVMKVIQAVCSRTRAFVAGASPR